MSRARVAVLKVITNELSVTAAAAAYGYSRLADGTDIEILNWLDDHSRYLLGCSAHSPVTGDIVVATFVDACNAHRRSIWVGDNPSFRVDGREDRRRPAPARQRCFTEWSAVRLLAC